ncbi:MAG TPA: hypothetical protein VGQ76_23850 [Thermoanaerobaculia bacterium]|jgi:hypothetical protein|nr:hypothetical protein [Thermoanaerobaculia bacterium]
MSEVELTKTFEGSCVYMRQEYMGGHIVIEKADPRIIHDAPASVMEGTELTITFNLTDFDGTARIDSGGLLLLEIDETPLELPITNGVATLDIQLFASARVKQQPPYSCDARLEPFEIGVTS